MSDWFINLFVDPGEANPNQNFVNFENAAITVTKDIVDPNGNPVADPTGGFTVTLNSLDQKGIAEGVTATYSNLGPGTYTIVENTIPSNFTFDSYSIDEDPGTPGAQITVASGETENLVVVNRQKTATIRVEKDVTGPNGEAVTDDHSFQVTLNGETKTVSESSPASWTVNPGTYGATEAADPDYTEYSNSSPATVASGGSATIYIVNRQKTATITVYKNVVGPDGVTDVTDAHPFSITLNGETKTVAEGAPASWTVNPGSYSATEAADVDYTEISNTSPATVTSNGTGSITVTNQQDPGSILIHKTDATSGDNLPGAEFQLLYKDGSGPVMDTKGGTVNNVMSDANGNAAFENLFWGEYMVKEFPPEGYGAVDSLVKIEAGNVIISLEIADPRLDGEIDIFKVDDSGAVLTGAGFTLYNSSKTKIMEPEKMVDEGGKVTFDGLSWGTYLVVETTIPDGFDAAADKEITIDASNAGETMKLTFTDTAIVIPPVEVAGIIEVLAFTGVPPVIPITGISAFIGGITLIAASLRRKKRK